MVLVDFLLFHVFLRLLLRPLLLFTVLVGYQLENSHFVLFEKVLVHLLMLHDVDVDLLELIYRLLVLLLVRHLEQSLVEDVLLA